MADSFKERHSKLIHLSFEISLIIKGFDGFIEILGAILLLYLNPSRLNMLVNFMTHGELQEDPKDIVANTLISISSEFSIDVKNFFVFYLMAHGIIKCYIIFLLWRRKLWAYPFSIVTFALFIIYQIYKYTINPSIWLILLTIFDILMIILTSLEYQRVKSSRIVG